MAQYFGAYIVMRMITAKAVIRERPAMRVEMMPLMVRAKPNVRSPKRRTDTRVTFIYLASDISGLMNCL